MFCLRQFAARYFARRYFPAGLGSGVLILSLDAASTQRSSTARFAFQTSSVRFETGGA